MRTGDTYFGSNGGTRAPNTVDFLDFGAFTVINFAVSHLGTCVVTSGPEIHCWGSGDALIKVLTPLVDFFAQDKKVNLEDQGLKVIQKVFAHNGGFCAELFDLGTYETHCWGKDKQVKMSHGFEFVQDRPTSVNQLVDLGEDVDASAFRHKKWFPANIYGGDHQCVLSVVGNVKWFGLNNQGQLGTGRFPQVFFSFNLDAFRWGKILHHGFVFTLTLQPTNVPTSSPTSSPSSSPTSSPTHSPTHSPTPPVGSRGDNGHLSHVNNIFTTNKRFEHLPPSSSLCSCLLTQ